MLERAFESHIFSPKWGRAMRFISGPRQCGKTTLAKAFLKKTRCSKYYYNWDSSEIKHRYQEGIDFIKEEVLPQRKSKEKLWVC